MRNGTGVSAELIRRMAAGETPEAIFRSFVPESWRAVLRACAIARTFNAHLYETVLRPWAMTLAHPEVPLLAELIEEHAVVPVPGEPEKYCLPDSDRSSYFSDWFTPARPELLALLRALETQIAQQAHEAGDELEELRHLLLADPERALELFDKLFARADRRRNFAACEDYVDVLRDPDRSGHLTPVLCERLQSRAGYVRARSYWAADYARSAQYLPPWDLARDAARLLRGEPRVWHVYGSGGAGKTMMLRWLVARHWVPAPSDVLCARVDFDFVSARAVGQHPWLILLEVAEQLGRRLPKNVFERLDAYAAYRVLLDRRPSRVARDVAQTITSLDSAAVEEDLLKDFSVRLKEASDGRPCVLVIDTLEELLLHGTEEAARLLRLLARLLDRCPGLRLIIAGRYNLRDSVPDSLDAFEDIGVEHRELGPFTRRQARAYLRQKRGITDDDLARAAFRKSDGLPFTLALCADVIESDPDITAEVLASHREPHLHYLIDRVVQRIDDRDVRWLLRYGVIPRRLSADDVKTVMAPWIARGIQGGADVDDPLQDAHHLQGRPDVFPTSDKPPTNIGLDDAWRRLLDYASASSWVSRHAGDDSVVVFHPNVVAPMRQLVALQPVARHLHLAFARRFEELAQAEPEQWIGHTREAVYHRFQAGAPDADASWRQAVDTADEDGRIDDMRELADEVLGPEYIDGDAPRQRAADGLLISHATLAAAHLTLATALVLKQAEETTYSPADPLWNEVERRLALVERLRQAAPSPFPPDSAESILKAGLLSGRNMHLEARQLIRDALSGEADDRWRERLQVTLARIQSAMDDSDAETTYRSALGAARSPASRLLISLELAQQLERRGRISQAFELEDAVILPRAECARGLTPPRPGGEREWLEALRIRATLAKARSQLRAFAPTEAMATIKRLDFSYAAPAQRMETYMLLAQGHHLLGQSGKALAALDEVRTRSTASEGPAGYRYLAASLMMKGAIEGELLAVDRAQESFDRAGSLWSDLGFPKGHPHCLLLYASYLARSLGDLRRAAQTLKNLQAADGQDEWAVQRGLLWRELALQGYQVSDEMVLVVPGASHNELLRGGVAAALGSQKRSERLAEALATVQPPAARLAALAGLAAYPTARTHAEHPELEVLAPLFDGIAQPSRTVPDHQVQVLHLAEFDRIRGRVEQASVLCDRAHQSLHRQAPNDPLPAWRRAHAQIRIQGEPRSHVSQLVVSTAPDDAPLLAAVGLWRAATRTASPPDREAKLAQAAAELSKVRQASAWEARILRFIGQTQEEESTVLAAERMLARLGHPEPWSKASRLVHDMARPHDERVVTIAPEPDSGLDHTALADTLLRDWRVAARAASGNLTEVAPGGNPVTSVQVQSDEAAAHAFPWELVPVAAQPGDDDVVLYRNLPDTAESADVRALQTALRMLSAPDLMVDGLLGTLTGAAVGAAMSRHISGAARTVLLSVGAAALWGLMRDSRKRTRQPNGSRTVLLLESAPGETTTDPRPMRRPLADVYRAQGCAALQVVSPEALPLTDKGAPALLHVNAPLKVKAGSTPYFDLSPVGLSHSDRLGSKASGSDLDPGRLVQWLSTFEPGMQPLIVLAPPRPSSTADIPLQLVLRNHFAAMLFASGVTPAVIGTGLTRAPDLQAMVLATGLLREASLPELHRAVRAVVLLYSEGDTGDRSGNAQQRKTRQLHEYDWGHDVLEALCTSMFATPSALRVSEPQSESEPA